LAQPAVFVAATKRRIAGKVTHFRLDPKGRR
jgi:hypothetical protein